MDKLYFSGPFAPMCELFVNQRRAVGVIYESRAKIIRHFDNFCKEYDVENYEITETIMADYSVKRPNEHDNTRLERLSTIKTFAQFLSNQGYPSYIMPELPKRSSAHVPMSKSLLEVCQNFMDIAHSHTSNEMPLFYTKTNGSYSKGTINSRFKTILWDVGIPYRDRGEGPRLYDLRHTFLFHNIKNWAEAGIPIHSKLAILSKYVGHTSVNATQWYLRLTAEVFTHIREVCER